jgi:hypothetical protein
MPSDIIQLLNHWDEFPVGGSAWDLLPGNDEPDFDPDWDTPYTGLEFYGATVGAYD